MPEESIQWLETKLETIETSPLGHLKDVRLYPIYPILYTGNHDWSETAFP